VDLFERQTGELKNYLPKDGLVNYHGQVVSNNLAEEFFEILKEKVAWKHDEIILKYKSYASKKVVDRIPNKIVPNAIVPNEIAADRIVTKRKVAWYANKSFKYTYSNTTKLALPWFEELEQLKSLVEEKSDESYNACLLNFYHTGFEGMSWHSDTEKELKPNAAIACLSFGAQRKFSFKHKTSKDLVSLFLQTGSLLIMKEDTQKYWLHSLPTTTKIALPRISLTFRTILDV
jgi:alkylated DNA repair dioxygenase AlkB